MFDVNALINALTANQINIDPDAEKALVPEGYRLEDLEHLHAAPRRIKQHIELRSAQSFIDYVERFSDDGATVFCDLKGQKFSAILDYHKEADIARWGDHRATYNCPVDTRWKLWTAHNGKAMNQVDFARFIENNLPDIVQPSGADMLNVSRSLQAKKKIDFKSDQTLSNGDIQFTYNEQTTGSAGQMEIPQEFTLGIPVYEGGAKYELKARLRYRINEGQLAMWYDLLRPERLLEDAFNELSAHIKKEVEGFARTYDAAL